MGSPDIDYSYNNNTQVDSLDLFLSENDRTFNQLTAKHSDTGSYKQRLTLATKPLQYYVNSLNNVSGLNNNDNFLSFTPIGNAQVVNIQNINDRPIPSTLQTTPSVYTSPYSTSPFLGSSNNINTYDTDTDLFLKTGSLLRNKNNQSELSQVKWASFADVSEKSVGVTTQNAGQHNSNDLEKSFNPHIPGLNVTPNDYSKGIGAINMDPGSNYLVSSRNALQNFANGPFLDCKQFKKTLNK